MYQSSKKAFSCHRDVCYFYFKGSSGDVNTIKNRAKQLQSCSRSAIASLVTFQQSTKLVPNSKKNLTSVIAKKFLQQSHEKHLETMLQYSSSKHPVHSALCILSQLCEMSNELCIHFTKQTKLLEALVEYIKDWEKMLQSKSTETLYAILKVVFCVVTTQEDLSVEWVNLILCCIWEFYLWHLKLYFIHSIQMCIIFLLSFLLSFPSFLDSLSSMSSVSVGRICSHHSHSHCLNPIFIPSYFLLWHQCLSRLSSIEIQTQLLYWRFDCG